MAILIFFIAFQSKSDSKKIHRIELSDYEYFYIFMPLN